MTAIRGLAKFFGGLLVFYVFISIMIGIILFLVGR